MNLFEQRLCCARKDFLRRSFVYNCRPDGRTGEQMRNISIGYEKRSNSLGFISLDNGEFEVRIAIRGEIVIPTNSNYFTRHFSVLVNFDGSESSSNEELEKSVTSLLCSNIDRLILSHIDSNSPEFALVGGLFSWHFFIEIWISALGGGLLQLSSIGLRLAFSQIKLPKVSLIANSPGLQHSKEVIDTDKVICRVNLKAPSRYSFYDSWTFSLSDTSYLSISFLDQLSVALCFVVNGDFAVVDPLLDEEAVAEATCSIIINGKQDILGISCASLVPLAQHTIDRVKKSAISLESEIFKGVENVINAEPGSTMILQCTG